MKKIAILILFAFSFLPAQAAYKPSLANANILMFGNSIVADGGTTWASMVHTVYPSATVINAGVGGRPATTMLSLISGTTALDHYLVPGVRNVCMVPEVINNVRTQPDPRTSANTHLQICDTLRAQGWEVILVVMSDIGASKQFFQSYDIDWLFVERFRAVDSILAKEYTTHSDGLWNMVEEVESANDSYNQTFYTIDKVHFKTAGYTAATAGLIAALESLGETQSPVTMLGRPRIRAISPSATGVSVTIDRFDNSYTYRVDTSSDGGFTWGQQSVVAYNQSISFLLTPNKPYRVRVQSIVGSRRSFFEYSKDLVMSGIAPVNPRSTIIKTDTAVTISSVVYQLLKFTHPVGFVYTDYEYRLDGGSWQPVNMTTNDNTVKVEYGTLYKLTSSTQDVRLRAGMYTRESAILTDVLPPEPSRGTAIKLGSQSIKLGTQSISLQ